MMTGVCRSFPGGLWLWDLVADPREDLVEAPPGSDHVFFSPTRSSPQLEGHRTQRNRLSGQNRNNLIEDTSRNHEKGIQGGD
jgi:hypothetical protein